MLMTFTIEHPLLKMQCVTFAVVLHFTATTLKNYFSLSSTETVHLPCILMMSLHLNCNETVMHNTGASQNLTAEYVVRFLFWDKHSNSVRLCLRGIRGNCLFSVVDVSR